VYVAAILACVKWPRWSVGLRVAGAIGLGLLAWAYHPAKGGWEHSWWGILGLIGWAYLVGFVVYLVARDRPAALVAAIALLYALFIADKTGSSSTPGSASARPLARTRRSPCRAWC
jgi:hypothetical protein